MMAADVDWNKLQSLILEPSSSSRFFGIQEAVFDR
jgi:hypothetical protein